MTTKQLEISRAKLEEARDRAAAARAEADRSVAPAYEEVARLEAEAQQLAAQVAQRQAEHEESVRQRYARQTFPLGPYLKRFTDALYDDGLNAAFEVYREMRIERNGIIAADEVLGTGIQRVGAAEPKLLDWLDSALRALDHRARDEAAAAIRAELKAG